MDTHALILSSATAADTERLGRQIGHALRGGECIELVSDVGGGKTTFVRGLAQGAGSEDRVASPTFTISRVYTTDQLEIHHFDFYRLAQAGLAAHELHDVIGDPGIVVVVEWGQAVAEVLPADRLTIAIARTSEEGRRLTLTVPPTLAYLVSDLAH